MSGIEPATPCLQGERFIHYTTTAPSNVFVIHGSHMLNVRIHEGALQSNDHNYTPDIKLFYT